MSTLKSRRTVARRGPVLLAVAGVLLLAVIAPAQAAVSHDLVVGSGSSWSGNAVAQWVGDVKQNGLQVVFTPSGSAVGRKDFAYKTTDFGVSDIGYQGTDPQTGDVDSSLGRPYAYLPVVAGGTAFPYQIKVGGQLIRNLRLSGETLTKIFTNQITMWNDPQIIADNNGRKDLPALRIIPIVHQEGSGSTAMFTRYMDTVYPDLWRPFFGSTGMTEYFPRKGNAIAQSGSDQVMNFLSSSAANGAIGYDEYSYALGVNYPVVKVENSAGYYTLPNQYNVAVALTQAVIDMDPKSKDYLLQDLDKVYTYKDPRTYPLSSYSYFILPTGNSTQDAKETTAKRQTLADFVSYAICNGQAGMGTLGYSSLPLNLVKASFSQVSKLKTADPGVQLSSQASQVSSCNNPTFDMKNPARNYLAEIAPMPQACDKTGTGPCGTTVDTGTQPVDTGKGSTGTKSGGKSGTGTGSTGSTNSGTNGGSTTPGTTGTTDAPSTTVDPVTGQVVNATNDGTTTAAGDVTVVSTEVGAYQGQGMGSMLGLLTVGLVAALLVAPPLLARRLRASGTGKSP